ncbi:MAG TPA: hypothetical protein VM659_28635 [Dongiaceae bacterium]|nr:hypothetical protein [Dongiaceae bacterium]
MAGKRKAAFRPTAVQRRDVMLFKAGGMSDDGIATELGICRNTLLKHFAIELAAAHQKEMAANLRRLRKAANAGNVTAIRHLDHKFGLVAAEDAFTGDSRREPRSTVKGKKEQAADAAETAGVGTGWGNDLKTPGTRVN